EMRKSYLEWTKPQPMPGNLQYGEVIKWLSDNLPDDAIIAGGAGNFAGWLHRHFCYKGFRTQLGSTNGPMGYGYPSAVAAKLAPPAAPAGGSRRPKTSRRGSRAAGARASPRASR